MNESEEYKWALKVVIKRQMRDLFEQLHESGEEVAVLSVNIKDGTCSQFGSSQGEWFLLEQRNLTKNFLSHCQQYNHRKDTRKSIFLGTSGGELTSTLGSSSRVTRSNDKTTVPSDAPAAKPRTTVTTRSSQLGRRVSARYTEGIAALMKQHRNTLLDGTEADSQATDASVNEMKEEDDGFNVDAYANMYNEEINETADDDRDYIPDDDSVKDPDFSLTEEINVAPIAVATKPGLTGIKKNIIGNLKRKKTKKKLMRNLGKLQCSQCPLVIQGAHGLKAHVDRVHLNIRKSKCEVCPKSFWSNCVLQEHMLAVHTRRCDDCDKYVVESTPWTENMTNETVRNVLCVCGATVSIYTRRGCPRKYLADDEPDENGKVKKRRKYRSDASFACGVCHKLFTSQKHCEQHQIMHSGVKSAVCHICGTSFAHDATLKRHMNRIHNAIENVCKICKLPFANLTALTLHNVKFHSETVNTNVTVENGIVDTETCTATPKV